MLAHLRHLLPLLLVAAIVAPASVGLRPASGSVGAGPGHTGAGNPPPNNALSLTSTPPSGAPVGATVAFTASIDGLDTPLYRFSVAPAGADAYRVLRDFSPTPASPGRRSRRAPTTSR